MTPTAYPDHASAYTTAHFTPASGTDPARVAFDMEYCPAIDSFDTVIVDLHPGHGWDLPTGTAFRSGVFEVTARRVTDRGTTWRGHAVGVAHTRPGDMAIDAIADALGLVRIPG